MDTLHRVEHGAGEITEQVERIVRRFAPTYDLYSEEERRALDRAIDESAAARDMEGYVSAMRGIGEIALRSYRRRHLRG